jgi:hypothetical protein
MVTAARTPEGGDFVAVLLGFEFNAVKMGLSV